MFDARKETVIMILETINWKESDMVLFKKLKENHNQICILVKTASTDESSLDVGDYMNSTQISTIEALAAEGFRHAEDYIIQPVPNVVNFSYTTDSKITFTNLSE